MAAAAKSTRFDARLHRPAKAEPGDEWCFVMVPREASETLPRRGRTSVDGKLNGTNFRATLEPDGQLSHWLRIDRALRDAAGVEFDTQVTVEIAPVDEEPEPAIPSDLRAALEAAPAARAVWDSTTTISRLDWIHWITSAKQAKTRTQRVSDACDMLASGKKRVCCFDPSGFYSKALRAPIAAE